MIKRSLTKYYNLIFELELYSHHSIKYDIISYLNVGFLPFHKYLNI